MTAQLELAYRVIDLVGVVLNGVLGGMIARKKGFDVIGFAVLAVISALGGGVLRDVLLQAGRPVALTDPAYLACAFLGAAVAFVVRVRGPLWRVFFPLADGIVLGAWAATGTVKSLQVGVAWLPALCLGVLTAVGGGMIRDVAVGRVPQVFGGNTLYATPALLSGAIVLLAHALGAPTEGAMLVATLAGAALALAARRYQWRLPAHGDGTYSAVRARMARARRYRRDPDA